LRHSFIPRFINRGYSLRLFTDITHLSGVRRFTAALLKEKSPERSAAVHRRLAERKIA
jgi:hypothetical protein